MKNPTNIEPLAYVKYHGNVFEVFSEPQALLVLFGALIFELTFFGLLLIALSKLSNKYKKGKNKVNLYVRGFLCGIIISMVRMAGGWIMDGKTAISHFTENIYFIGTTISLTVSTIFVIWLYCVYVFSWKEYFKDLFETDESTMFDLLKIV